MGNCSPNRLEDYSSVYFDVHNVDANLFQHSKGQIQVTSNELVLHQRATTGSGEATIIRWPLNGVRRYGYFKDIFLFESGRKCPTGEGLFAFKCSKAKRLNELLHHTILNNAASGVANLCDFSQQESENITNVTNNAGKNTVSSSASSCDNETLSSSAAAVRPINGENTVSIEAGGMKSFGTRDGANRRERAENHYDMEESYYRLNRGNDANANNSPYYVNDLKSLVRLPLNLSTVDMGDASTRQASSMKNKTSAATADYINYEQVNQDLLHLAKKINGGAAPVSQRSSHQSNSLLSKTLNYERIKGALSSSSSRLNYIIPEMLNRGGSSRTAHQQLPADNSDEPPAKQPTVEKQIVAEKPVANQNNQNVVYCDIDFINKTPAFHSIHKP